MSRDFSDVCQACGYQCMTVEQCHAAQNQTAKQTEQPDDWSTYIAKELHYPDCWDTMAYPTVYDAINEIASCNICKPIEQEPSQSDEITVKELEHNYPLWKQGYDACLHKRELCAEDREQAIHAIAVGIHDKWFLGQRSWDLSTDIVKSTFREYAIGALSALVENFELRRRGTDNG